MSENEFAVAIFALFFVGYVLIRLIFAIPRTRGAVELVENDVVDTTYHYDEDGCYRTDYADYDRDNS